MVLKIENRRTGKAIQGKEKKKAGDIILKSNKTSSLGETTKQDKRQKENIILKWTVDKKGVVFMNTDAWNSIIVTLMKQKPQNCKEKWKNHEYEY